MTTWLVISLFGGWFGLTLVYQLFLMRLRPYVWRFDIFRILPAYHFFLHRPPYFVLSYRDRLRSGVESPWQDLHFRRPTKWYTALWHPHFIVAHTIQNWMLPFADLTESDVSLFTLPSQLQFPYQALLWHIIQYPASPQSEARQFRILRGAGHFSDAPKKVIFVSDYHDIKRG